MDVQAADFLTIAALVALEGLLSTDNALIMAILVLGLPRSQHKKALTYGLVGGFHMRVGATLLAVYLIGVLWVKLAGGVYLLYLAYQHFFDLKEGDDRIAAPTAKPMLGLSPLWATIVRVECVNLAFSIDSILVAVAVSPKVWVVVTGGLLGIVALRLLVGQLIVLVERYPALLDGAFIIIAWIGLKLALDWAYAAHYVAFEVPQWFSLLLIGVIFMAAFINARIRGPAPVDTTPDTLKKKAEELIAEEASICRRP